jgi:glutathionylspermidine synthase
MGYKRYFDYVEEKLNSKGNRKAVLALTSINISRPTIARINEVMSSFLHILNYLMERFYSDSRLQKALGFEDRHIRILRGMNQYRKNFAVVRFDVAFMNREEFYVLEVNTDTPGGNEEQNIVNNGFTQFLPNAGRL